MLLFDSALSPHPRRYKQRPLISLAYSQHLVYIERRNPTPCPQNFRKLQDQLAIQQHALGELHQRSICTLGDGGAVDVNAKAETGGEQGEAGGVEDATGGKVDGLRIKKRNET